MRYVMVLLALGLLALPVFAQDANTTDNSTSNVTDNSTVNVTSNATDNSTSNVTANNSELNLTDTAGLLATCSGNESASVGALPGDFMYGFKRFFENVDKFFTWDKSQSALKHAKYGKTRAVEAHLMACKAHDQEAAGNTTQANATSQTVEQLAEDGNKELDQAHSDLEAAVDAGTANNTTISQVDNETRNSIEVLQRVYERAPEAAKDGLLNALNNSIANYERHQEKMAEKEHGKGRGDNQTVNGTSENETENETSSGDNETGRGNGKGREGDDSGNVTGSGHGKGGSDDNETEAGTGDDNGVNETAGGAPVGVGNGSSGKGRGGESGDD